MTHWKQVPLDSLADYINGFAFSPDSLGKHGLPVVRIEQLKNRDAEFDYYAGNTPDRVRLQNGDLVFSWSASLFLDIWDRGPALLNQHLFKVVPRPGVDKMFLRYLIESKIPELLLASHGSTMQHITRKELTRCVAHIPECIDEQRLIANRIRVLDDHLKTAAATIAKHERIYTGLLQTLLTRGIDERGELREEDCSVPPGWKTRSLEDLTSVIVDGVHAKPNYRQSGVPFVTVRNLTAGEGIDFDNLNYISHSDHEEFCRRVRPQPGDVLVTKDGTLGTARVVPSGCPEFSIFVSVALLRPKLRIVIPEWIWLYFDSGSCDRQLGDLSSGTGLKHIHLEHFKKFLIPTPPREEQIRICSAVGVHVRGLRARRLGLEKLKRIRCGLMRDLLTGGTPILPLPAGGGDLI